MVCVISPNHHHLTDVAAILIHCHMTENSHWLCSNICMDITKIIGLRHVHTQRISFACSLALSLSLSTLDGCMCAEYRIVAQFFCNSLIIRRPSLKSTTYFIIAAISMRQKQNEMIFYDWNKVMRAENKKKSKRQHQITVSCGWIHSDAWYTHTYMRI